MFATIKARTLYLHTSPGFATVSFQKGCTNIQNSFLFLVLNTHLCWRANTFSTFIASRYFFLYLKYQLSFMKSIIINFNHSLLDKIVLNLFFPHKKLHEGVRELKGLDTLLYKKQKLCKGERKWWKPIYGVKVFPLTATPPLFPINYVGISISLETTFHVGGITGSYIRLYNHKTHNFRSWPGIYNGFQVPSSYSGTNQMLLSMQGSHQKL